MGILSVMGLGVIRLEYNGISLGIEPTYNQKHIIKNIALNNRTFYVDFISKNGTVLYHVTYSNYDENIGSLICNHIYRFITDGIKPDPIINCSLLREVCDAGGATSASVSNDTAPVIPMGDVIMRPSILAGKSGKKDKKNKYDQTEINGKTLTTENTKQRHFYFTEEQIKRFSKKKL
jgi:hypothetical protein